MKNNFKELFVAGSFEEAAQLIDSNLNINIHECRPFELLLTKKEKAAKDLLKKIVTHPNWDPNYRLVDGWTPLERAVLNNREDVARLILKHPKLKTPITPRVVSLAKMNGTITFQKYLSKQIQKQR